MFERSVSDAAGSGLRLQLVGEPRLWTPTATCPLVLDVRDAALLAVLARSGATPRQRLAAWLWPDSEPEAAHNSLRQRLYRLRQQAGSAHPLVTGEGTLALQPGVCHDARAPDLATLESEATARELLGTLDFAAFGELADWVAGARRQWRSQCREALAEAASRCEIQGDLDRALAWAQRLLREETAVEHAYRRVMRLHYLRGERQAGLDVFDACCRALEQELKAFPGRETLDLVDMIERIALAPAALGCAGAGASMVLKRDVAAAAPTDGAPRLYGRIEALRAVDAAWQRGRVVLLTGELGIGKTRLLQALGEAPGGGPVRAGATAFDESALAHWRTSGRNLSLIDDLHLADAASLDALLRWLPAARADGWRVALAVRPGEISERLAAWMATRRADLFDEVALAALGLPDLRQWLADPWRDRDDSQSASSFPPDAWAAPLLEHTAGNPWFVTQTLHSLHAARLLGEAVSPQALPLTAAVEQVLARQLAALEPLALKLLRLAAVAALDERACSPALAAAVLKLPVDLLLAGWRYLESGGWLRGGVPVPGLLRAALLRAMPRPVVSRLRQAIAGLGDSA